MASVTKFTDGAVGNELKHNHQLLASRFHDPTKTHLNYSLNPNVTVPRDEYFEHRADVQKREMEYYHSRKGELYCYNRKDVKTAAGLVLTLPKTDSHGNPLSQETQDLFFKTMTEALSDRYGRRNVISAVVHYDEGVYVNRRDADGNIIRGPDGKAVRDLKIGQPHLHFDWIPAIKIDHAALAKKKNHVKAMDGFQEKISAKEVLTKSDLKTLHKYLQDKLDTAGIDARVLIKAEGEGKSINFTVSQLQKITKATGLTLDQLKDIQKEMSKAKEVEAKNAKYEELITKAAEMVKSVQANARELKEQVADLEQENSVLRKSAERAKSLEAENKALKEKIQTLEQHQEKTFETGWGDTSGWGESKTKTWEY